MLADCGDFDEVQRVAEHYPDYKKMFDGVGEDGASRTLEDKFFEHEVRVCLPPPHTHHHTAHSLPHRSCCLVISCIMFSCLSLGVG